MTENDPDNRGHRMARWYACLSTALICIALLPWPADAQMASRDLIAQASSDPPGRYRRPRGDTPLPDGKVARGTRNIAAAWFSDPTTRYRHFALGTEHEPETLVVSTSDRRVYRLKLPSDSVFEDREPRIADIDGDGQDEIIVVRSYLKQGAALAIIAVRGDGLEIIAETPPIGEHFRWLNPAGVADFDGDGKPDVALVRMPHTHGELELWTLRDGKLVRTYRESDVSNHAVRGLHFKLSAVADFDGDGVADLAIPSFDRRSLRILGFRNGRVREIDRIALPAVAAEDFELVQRHGRPAVRVGLNGGRNVVVTP